MVLVHAAVAVQSPRSDKSSEEPPAAAATVPPPAAAATASAAAPPPAVAAPALGTWGMCMAAVLMVTPGCATVTATVAAAMAAVAPAHKLGAVASGEVVLVACVGRRGFEHRADMCSRQRTHNVCMRADSGSGLLELMCGHD